jgi:hypothetical protein
MRDTPDLNDATYWRTQAEEVLSRVETFHNPEARATLLVIAKGYLSLAANIERKKLSHNPAS